MSRQWKPGDVAMVDSWRGKGQIAFRCGRGKEEPAWCVLDGADTRGLDDHEVTNAVPLVVIDPDDRQQVEWLAIAYAATVSTRMGDEYLAWENRSDGARLRIVVDLQAALRKYADPKPPKPPKPEEPTGLSARVTDARDVEWAKSGRGCWFALGGQADCCDWESLCERGPLEVTE